MKSNILRSIQMNDDLAAGLDRITKGNDREYIERFLNILNDILQTEIDNLEDADKQYNGLTVRVKQREVITNIKNLPKLVNTDISVKKTQDEIEDIVEKMVEDNE